MPARNALFASAKLVALTLAFSSVARAEAPPSFADPAFENEERAILDELLRADTSHGHETAALEPIAKRFRKAGIPVEIVESAPGRGNLIARLKGNQKKRPLLLLAHIDVVPIEGQPWTSPPFSPTEKDGYLIARGVGDDKSMAAGIAATALAIARAKTPLSRDLIVALTAGEETGGDAGARWLAAHRRDLIDAELALNEGGPLLLAEDGARVEYAGIGAAEKTYQSFRLTARGKGGHSSLPSPEADTVTHLARALVKLGDHRFPARVLSATRDYLAFRATTEKPRFADALRRAAAAQPDATGASPIAPDDDRALSQNALYNATIRTTCIATQLEASPADNVLPTTALAVVNCRILPDETREATQRALAAAIADPAIEITPLLEIGVAPASPVDSPLGREVTAAVQSAATHQFGKPQSPAISPIPPIPVVHTLGTGATDSRHLRAIGIASYGLSSAPITLEESLKGRGAHGPDERRPVKWLAPGARYLREIILTLAK